MNKTLLIASRELKALLRSPLGYVAASLALLLDGLLFMTRALGGESSKRLSAKVLEQFFLDTSGITMVLALLLSFRVLSAEMSSGSYVLLNTSPVSHHEVVLGKFLAVLVVLLAILGLTSYMPAMIFVNGRVSLGHIGVGYLGLALLGAASLSIGVFASSLTRIQVVAIVIAGAILAVLVLMWLAAKVTEPPIRDFLNHLALHHRHQREFMSGVLRAEHVVYYVGVTGVFLMAATKALGARRWA